MYEGSVRPHFLFSRAQAQYPKLKTTTGFLELVFGDTESEPHRDEEQRIPSLVHLEGEAEVVINGRNERRVPIVRGQELVLPIYQVPTARLKRSNILPEWENAKVREREHTRHGGSQIETS